MLNNRVHVLYSSFYIMLVIKSSRSIGKGLSRGVNFGELVGIGVIGDTIFEMI